MLSIFARLSLKPKPPVQGTRTKRRDGDTYVPLIKTLW